LKLFSVRRNRRRRHFSRFKIIENALLEPVVTFTLGIHGDSPQIVAYIVYQQLI